ncbi:MAG TPA: GntR family transcriptional regulator [Clostridia bacterium]|nr:GntR family transcriptional regulator [Clostridia bacterium]
MVKSESLRNIVYNYLVQKIQGGELKPNDKINESTICNELSLSRTPTREALIKLEADGLLMYTPNKGFTVKEVSEKDRDDIYIIIGSLDSLAATLAMSQITEADIIRMYELTDKMDIAIKYANFPDYAEFQTLFHNVYTDKCKNRFLIDILVDLRKTFVPQAYLTEMKPDLFDHLNAANDEHRQIIRLFEKKDLPALQHFLKEKHWQNIL